MPGSHGVYQSLMYVIEASIAHDNDLITGSGIFHQVIDYLIDIRFY